jgi:hypothetical protein
MEVSRNPFLAQAVFVKKINYIGIKKQVLEVSTALSDACVLSFPHNLMQTGEKLCNGHCSPDEIFSICLTSENQEIYP